jgi:hypothetical protein
LVEQWIAGAHIALEIVTELERLTVLRILLADFVELPPVDLTGDAPAPGSFPPPDGAIAPPGLVDPSVGFTGAEQTRTNTRSTALTAFDTNRLSTAALATTTPSGLTSRTLPTPLGPSRRDSWMRGPAMLDLSGYGSPNRRWTEKLRPPWRRLVVAPPDIA